MILFKYRFADIVSHCLEKRIRHAAANDKIIYPVKDVFQHIYFCGNFDAADYGGRWRCGIFHRFVKILNFVFEKKAGGAFSDMAGNCLIRGVAPVRRCEGVVYKDIAQRREEFAEAVIIFFFFRVKSYVFKQYDLALFQPVNNAFYAVADGRIDETNVLFQQFRQALCDWSEAHFWNNLAIRPAEVRNQYELCPLFNAVLYCRQCCGNAGVVGNVHFFIVRDVVIYPYYSPFAL